MNEAEIVNKIPDEDIFLKYVGYFKEKSSFNSPFRKDKIRSCSIFRNSSNRLLFKDFATGELLDKIGIVMKKYNCTYREALDIILIDFGLKKDGISPMYVKMPERDITIMPERVLSIKYNQRDWNSSELAKWSKFGITHEALLYYNIIPCISVVFNYDKSFEKMYIQTDDDPIYIIPIESRFKMYRPFTNNPKNKWKSNINRSCIFGLDRISAGTLVTGIVSGPKDLLCLYSQTGIKSVCLPSETSVLSEKLVNILSEKSEKLFVLMDNDKAGINAMNTISSKYPIIKPIYLSDTLGYSVYKKGLGLKDIAEIYEHTDINLLKLINKCL